MTDLNPAARVRLQENAQGLFTSDLSVNEFALLHALGFQPLGLVMGSSVYHIGLQQSNWGQNMELEVITGALYRARELAMTRLQAEAQALQADGVVGVRLQLGGGNLGLSSDLAEFVAVGTAVRAPQGQDWRANGAPFTSALSGQELWTLHTIGYRPLGLVMGTCVYHIAHQGFMQALRTLGRNTEMTNYSQALYSARELAMERMQAEARAHGAGGVVGVSVSEANYGWDPHVIEFFALGTAVLPMPGAERRIEPAAVVNLND